MLSRRVKIVPRTLISFFVVFIVVPFIGWQSISSMDKIIYDITDIAEYRLPSVQEASLLQRRVFEMRMSAMDYMLNDPHTEQSQQALASFNEAKRILQEELQVFQPLIGGDEEKKKYDSARQAIDAYMRGVDAMAVSYKNQEERRAFFLNELSSKASPILSFIQELGLINERSATESVSKVRAMTAESKRYTFIALIVSVFLTVVVVYVFTRSIIKPLRGLIAVNKKVADSDLTEIIVVEGRDEISELQAATAGMLLSLRDTVFHISSSSHLLAASAEEMSVITRESKEGINLQNLETEMAATAVNEMTLAGEEVARNAVAASASTQDSESSARAGMSRVEETICSIEKLSISVQGTSVQIEQLASQTESIAKVLGVIRSISDQTHLLALNAAIEAARSGELGRGFAVVADEVRALAHRTQESTQDIEKMIYGIRAVTCDAVSSMLNTSGEAINTLNIARETGLAIAEITRAVTDINERNYMIATASEEQAQVAKCIDKSLVSINGLSLRSMAAANQASNASDKLSTLSVNLNDLVAKFNL